MTCAVKFSAEIGHGLESLVPRFSVKVYVRPQNKYVICIGCVCRIARKRIPLLCRVDNKRIRRRTVRCGTVYLLRRDVGIRRPCAERSDFCNVAIIIRCSVKERVV